MELERVCKVKIVEYKYADLTEKKLNELLDEGWELLHIGDIRGHEFASIVYTLGELEEESQNA